MRDSGSSARVGGREVRFCLSLLFAFLMASVAVNVGADPGEVKTWKEPLTQVEFVWVAGGCFEMGSRSGEEGRSSDEGPVHRVCLDGYWMGKREVTREQFQRFVEATDYKTDAEKEGFSWIYTGEWERRKGYNWHHVGFDQGGDHPVVHVSWNDAKTMADWLSKKSESHFRLPTEAEWEYACRGGTKTSRYWGDDSKEACRNSNVADETAAKRFSAWTVHQCEDGFVFTAPTGRYRPNDFGLYDMLGNVWEWCEDHYGSDAYRSEEHRSKNPLFQNNGAARVIRGGSWYSRPEIVRCAARNNLHETSRRGYDLGFRLVRIP